MQQFWRQVLKRETSPELILLRFIQEVRGGESLLRADIESEIEKVNFFSFFLFGSGVDYRRSFSFRRFEFETQFD